MAQWAAAEDGLPKQKTAVKSIALRRGKDIRRELSRSGGKGKLRNILKVATAKKLCLLSYGDKEIHSAGTPSAGKSTRMACAATYEIVDVKMNPVTTARANV